MGVTRFLERLEASFLTQLSDKDVPRGINPRDSAAVSAWFNEAFGVWFLAHRDDVLGKEWMKRGWAVEALLPDGQGTLKISYRVKPDCAPQIDDWLQDRID